MPRMTPEQLEEKRATIRERTAGQTTGFDDRLANARAEAQEAFQQAQEQAGGPGGESEDVLAAVGQQKAAAEPEGQVWPQNEHKGQPEAPASQSEQPRRRGRPPKAAQAAPRPSTRTQATESQQQASLAEFVAKAMEQYRAMDYDADEASRLVLAYALLECGNAVLAGLQGLKSGILAVSATLAAKD